MLYIIGNIYRVSKEQLLDCHSFQEEYDEALELLRKKSKYNLFVW